MSDIICLCCVEWLVYGDVSACRDYYGHTHPHYDGPYRVVGESSITYAGVECAGCGVDLPPLAGFYWAEEVA